jgi:hypothetical protein
MLSFCWFSYVVFIPLVEMCFSLYEVSSYGLFSQDMCIGLRFLWSLQLGVSQLIETADREKSYTSLSALVVEGASLYQRSMSNTGPRTVRSWV